MPVLLIAISRFLNQSESIFIKKYNAKHGKGNFIFAGIISLTVMVFFLCKDVVVDDNGLQFTSKMLFYGIVSGISYASAYFTTCLALNCGSFVLTSLMLSYSILITVIHGLIVGESISILGYVGLALIVCSLYLVKGEEKGDNVKITKKWLLFIIIAVLGNGVFGIMMRQQQLVFEKLTGIKGIYDNEFMIISLAISAIILFIIGFIKERKDASYILKHGTLYAVGAGLSNGATNMLMLLVYTLAPMSFVAPVSSGTGILVAFIISKLLYHEKFSKLQYLGVLLGAVALVLFNL